MAAEHCVDKYSAPDLVGSGVLFFVLSQTFFGPESHTGAAFLDLLMHYLGIFVFLNAVSGVFRARTSSTLQYGAGRVHPVAVVFGAIRVGLRVARKVA